MQSKPSYDNGREVPKGAESSEEGCVRGDGASSERVHGTRLKGRRNTCSSKEKATLNEWKYMKRCVDGPVGVNSWENGRLGDIPPHPPGGAFPGL